MKRLAVAMVALLALTAGCSPDDVPVPNESRVDVDTPALQEAKERAGIEPCAEGQDATTDGVLPATSLACLGGGRSVDLSTLRGPMVVNLWGSWCGPCRKELPVLADFYAEHGARVPMLGIDYLDVQPENALALAAKSGITYPQVADPGGDLSGLAPFGPIRGLPMTVFVAADGTATVMPVVIESEQQLVDLVREHLGVRL